MAWTKRRGQGTPSPAPVPTVQMYNPNQHSNQENHWHHQDVNPSPNSWYGQAPPTQQTQYPYQDQQQSNYWQVPYNQQLSNQNVTPQYQDPQFNQPAVPQNQLQRGGYYPTPDYQQQQVSNDHYNQQTRQQYNFAKSKVQTSDQLLGTVAGADTWNWGWGDEDNSNVQSLAAQNSNVTVNQNLTEPVANEESWNWTVEDTNSTSSLNYVKPEVGSAAGLESYQPQNVENSFVKPAKHKESVDPQRNFEIRSPDQVVQRVKVDHLTPQWSMDSQLSQESSDDVVQTSESDKILSRSSTISQSPISGHDNIDGLTQQIKHDNHNLQEINQKGYENKEILANVKEELAPSPPSNLTPPPPVNNTLSDDSKNPYKRIAGPSHKAANLFRSTPPAEKLHFYQPPPFNHSVNLETLPDNSEQPDSLPLPLQTRKITPDKTAGSAYPENNEIAPINERNQYLETGQLSDESTNQLRLENVDTLPPPGLRRMVLGQMETNDVNLNLHVNESADEPPPGLSRMVLGQTESASSLSNILNQTDGNLSRMVLGQTESSSSLTNQIEGPPVGFHRMIPGESSSPESTSRYQLMSGAYQDERRREDYNSEVEMNQLSSRITPQPRSATIGADTPPVDVSQNVNRSETIGGGTVDASSNDNRVGAIGVDNNMNNQDLSIKSETRRESIEGQPQDDMNSLVNAVRDLTVGTGSVNNEVKRRSREESTDSELDADRSASPTDRKNRRYPDERRDKPRNRDRYSPESYKDKRYDKKKPRDKRYEDDTDYYSDKERRRGDDRDRRDEYDKKYGSLRRDREKDRRKKDYDRRDAREYDRRDGGYDRREAPREYERRDGRGGYYDRYDYEDPARSRPSSRSDSMHDSYRERMHESRRYRDRDRERDHHRRSHRDPFNPYMQGFSYDPYSPYYQQYQYQYYENLRRTNPQAYAEWYRKYYQQSGAPSSGAFGAEDRASVHSGRSSANEELKDRYMRQSYYSHTSLPHMGSYYREPHISSQYGMDESSYSRPFEATDSSIILDESTAQPQRLTPAKFTTAHVKASISSGQLVKILPHYPLDGQSASVELVNLPSVLCYDQEIKELVEFPGPLTKGQTHKKTIIEYCESKIRNAMCGDEVADHESYILMWKLMILLIRQNGMVVGADIAELLMKDRNLEVGQRPSSVTSNNSSVVIENAVSEGGNVPVIDGAVGGAASVLKEEFVTNKFREYLIYGSGKEALEWAMKHGLWGHALFLASKLDKRTYANVMMRFANGLTMNDPLQTLYQLLSGRLPAAVTGVAEEKWGDWRPHLAMILSNTSSRPELDRKAITTLADTLMTRGSLYAAQFCYLMAEVGFSRYGTENAKLVLLGSSHLKPFVKFATNEAIHLTEIYEYACSLNESTFIIPEFQPYKYLIATRLSDRGLLEKSLAYLEQISISITRNPSVAQLSIINRVYQLADRLKYNDPIGDADESGVIDLNVSRPDNSWLKDLKAVQDDYNMGLITHESVNDLADHTPDMDAYQQQQATYDQQVQMQHEAWQQQQIDEQYQKTGQQWPGEQLVEQAHVEQQHHEVPQEGYNGSEYQDPQQIQQQQQQQYWGNQQQWAETQQNANELYNQQSDPGDLHQRQNEYWNNAQTEPEEVEKEPDEEFQRPQISMPNQSQGRGADNENAASPHGSKNESPAKAKPSPKLDKQTSTGWFGGIWNRLALRPKNQMKLPDDKNPTIVWDPEKKKWVNLEEDASEVSAELKPPPKMSDMMGHSQLGAAPGAVSFQTNFQMGLPSVPSYDPGQPQQQPSQPSSMPYLAPNGNMSPNAPSVNPVMPVAGGIADEPPRPAQPNMFKLQRGRNLKKSYVDVFNPGGKAASSAPALLPGMESFGVAPPGGTQMNFFVPQPVTDPNAPTDFLTPAPTVNDNVQTMM